MAVASLSDSPRRSTIDLTSSETVQTCTDAGSPSGGSVLRTGGAPTPGRYAGGVCQTGTWLRLSRVKGSRVQDSQRSRSLIPASCAIRSSSAGHT